MARKKIAEYGDDKFAVKVYKDIEWQEVFVKANGRKLQSNPKKSNLEIIAEELRKMREELSDENVRPMAIDEGEQDSVMYEVGKLVGVIYRQDGENYIHQFNLASQPTLAVSEDGTQLHIVGGQYVVTEKGIEDDA